MNREEKANYYDRLMQQYQINENQLSRIPKLSIEEQSRLVDINEKYSPENQEKVNNLKQQLVVLEQQLKQLF